MNISRSRTRVGACLLVAALYLGARPALAHGAPHVPPITAQGTVIYASNTLLQVATGSGTFSFVLSNNTHVYLVAHGSRADVTPTTIVKLHFLPGTTLINGIDVLPPSVPSSTAGADHDRQPRPTGTPFAGGHKGHHKHAAVPPPRTEVVGQVVVFAGSSITIRDTHGHTATYTLNGFPPITKILNGSIADLGVGETVRADRNAQGTCVDVTILNA